MLTTQYLVENYNFQSVTFAVGRILYRAGWGICDDYARIRAAVPAVLHTVATILRLLAVLVDFVAYVLIGAWRGVIVLAIGAIAVVALTLKAALWTIELCTALDLKWRPGGMLGVSA